jgi:hypothetical protein
MYLELVLLNFDLTISTRVVQCACPSSQEFKVYTGSEGLHLSSDGIVFVLS